MDKPLHVQVAEAMEPGKWHRIEPCPEDAYKLLPDVRWLGRYNWYGGDWETREVPRYDTDWLATGPLIEKYGITLLKDFAPAPHPGWRAIYHACDDLQFGWEDCVDGPTPLIAVCNLLLALKTADKL